MYPMVLGSAGHSYNLQTKHKLGLAVLAKDELGYLKHNGASWLKVKVVSGCYCMYVC